MAAIAGASGLAAADQSYCIHIDRSKVPALVNDLKLSVLVNVGTCSSVSVTADGVAIPAVYPATAGSCLINTTGTDLVVTAVNVTVAGTGAAAKATLYNNWHWAYSLTLDDGRQTQVLNAKPLLDAKGWHAGAAIVGSWVGNGSYYMTWAEIQALRSAGWSIYNHTWTHPNPVTCANFSTEFTQDQAQFLTQLPGYHVSHIVYPYEGSGSSSCAGFPPSFLISGEVGSGGISYVDAALPNVYLVPRNGLYGIDPTANEGIAATAGNNSRPTWMITITHSVTAGSGAAEDAYSTNQACLTSLFNYLDSNFLSGGKKNLWFAPSGEVQDYLFTRDNAVLSSCAVASPTPSPVAAATGTRTPTPSTTRSASPSATPTPTATATPSASATLTAANTHTATPSASVTASLTGTLTATPSASPTPSRSATATPSLTASPSAMPSLTQAPTLTSTFSAVATPSPTLTRSATDVPSPTGTPSATAAPSSSATPSFTAMLSESTTPNATATPSRTATQSPTVTLSPTATQGPTLASSLTATPSFSAAPSRTGSPTVTLTPSLTVTESRTLPATLTVTPSASATTAASVTASPSPSPGVRPVGGPLIIDRVAVAPNPDPTRVLLLLEGSVEQGEITVWSVALKRLISLPTGPLAAGWAVVALPAGALAGLPDGLYFLTVRVGRGPAQAGSRPFAFWIQK